MRHGRFHQHKGPLDVFDFSWTLGRPRRGVRGLYLSEGDWDRVIPVLALDGKMELQEFLTEQLPSLLVSQVRPADFLGVGDERPQSLRIDARPLPHGEFLDFCQFQLRETGQ